MADLLLSLLRLAEQSGNDTILDELVHNTAQDVGLADLNELDAAGHYDDFEIDRVVTVELKPNATQSELVSALEPGVDRLMRQYKDAQAKLKAAREKNDKPAIETAENELKALLLFRSDMGAFGRLYTFLSQIFDYGNTAIEKRAIFYKRLLPLPP